MHTYCVHIMCSGGVPLPVNTVLNTAKTPIYTATGAHIRCTHLYAQVYTPGHPFGHRISGYMPCATTANTVLI